MNFDAGFFEPYTWTFNDFEIMIKKDDINEDDFDVTKNNLSSIKEFIEFFKMLLYFMTDGKTDKIEDCFKKLDYLGFSSTGKIEMSSSEPSDILNSMVEAAYLYHQTKNEMNRLIYNHFLDKVIELAK